MLCVCVCEGERWGGGTECERDRTNEGVQFSLICWPAVVLIRELLCTGMTELAM